ncbi:hypothetical protein RB195_016429 [Necator americanus]|uniref:Uncharacterized protein n=1 Tax=Necator americanus TaxID=51031 RepID=A0ABR1C2R7_NECAM
MFDPRRRRSQAASLPMRDSPHHDVWIGDLGSTIYEIDVVYRRMTCERYQHLAPPSKVAETGRSPCPTSSEEFVGFELEEATWPKTEVVD